jgi:class 3 adenylate cyclase
MSSLKRRLAAIVFTDIVGFTNLSSKDEEGAYNLVKKQREILKPIVEKHEGEWLKEEGDGLLLSFPSSKEAVNCSIQMQAAVKNIEDLNLRIGIHQGDIIIENKDVFGDDVNIASRIEPFAAAGGIAVSQKIQQDLSSNPEFKFKFIDTPKLKGVLQEVSVYCIISHGLPESKKSDIQAKVELKKKYYKEILISTLFGIILFSYLPQFFQSGDFNFFQSSFSRTANLKNPVTGELHSTKHSEDILIELIIADSLLLQNTLSENLEAITTADILLNEDSLQGDYYSLRGRAYFQRAKLLNDSPEMIIKSETDLNQAVASLNININYIARAYMTLSDIYLSKNELQKADKAIKKALRANKRIEGIRDRFRNINRIKLQ